MSLLARRSEFFFWCFITTIGGIIPISVGGLIVYLFAEGSSIITWDLFSRILSNSWFPADEEFGILPLIVGTITSAAAVLPLVVCLGIPSALYFVLFANERAQTIFSMVVGTLSGLPSVVVGIFVMEVTGINFTSAVIVLFLLVAPQFILMVATSLFQLHKGLLISAKALGLGDFGITVLILRQISLPVFGAMLVSLGRGFGEAVALTFVAGNVATMMPDWSGPIRTLTTTIVLELDFATGAHYSILHIVALSVTLLIAVTVILSGIFSRRNNQ
ncbi:ABC transporter permease subunit [Aliikangiella coralliicola]|uniref:ABC transporter permease subunit n=1 Tax=Aliikangiella coralliicola TaxID=2592383 RepID=A0A545UFT7_9GAMM|nr:ABC transporter permease subunit [Aliikangiella coralliicola]TQV88338.1 ABC transporter permease subunit [Aliikangiella coralliicola]